jgi:hypothetical protein
MNNLDQKSEAQAPYRYPWARALMILVLYGALLVFLWHFPTPGIRSFFRNLLGGVLYLLAGVGLLIVTFIFVMLFPLPPLPLPADNADVEWEDEDGVALGGVYPARSLLVPDFKLPEVEPEVWDILYEIEDEMQPASVISADAYTGIISVAEGSEGPAANALLNEIRSRLRRAGISVRVPR